MLESIGRGENASDMSAIARADEIAEMTAAVKGVLLETTMRSYIVRLCEHTRDRTAMAELRLGVSLRGADALMQIAQVSAASQGWGYVNVDDVHQCRAFCDGAPHVAFAGSRTQRDIDIHLVVQALRYVTQPEPVQV